MVVIAYVSFRLAVSGSSHQVQHARAGDKEETEFSFGGMVRDIGRVRHLQVIVGIMVAMYLVDTLVEYQFQVSASSAFKGDRLTAFFGQFYGLWLNIVEFLFQLFVTAWVVRRFGVAATRFLNRVNTAGSFSIARLYGSAKTGFPVSAYPRTPVSASARRPRRR